MDFEFFRTVMLPFFAGCAPLVIALMGRNIAISERIRALCADLVSEVDHERSATLAIQMEVLYRRFFFSKAGTTLVFVSVLMFTAAALERGKAAASALFFLGVATTGGALAFALADLWKSDGSLGREIQYAKDRHRVREEEREQLDHETDSSPGRSPFVSRHLKRPATCPRDPRGSPGPRTGERVGQALVGHGPPRPPYTSPGLSLPRASNIRSVARR
jgi:hypothetical protein